MRCLFAIGLIISFYSGFSQNLVPNFSFEKKQKCPPDFVSFYREIYTIDWESSNIGTPDYFNACANKCGVPHNWVGSAKAFHGNAYMGIIACMQQFDQRQIPYREYIRVKLKDTLQAGNVYYASMKVRLAESCIATCNGMGMRFSESKMNSNKNINYQERSDITFQDNLAPNSKNEWLSVCGKYEAKGDETYLIIGNFLSNHQMEYFEFDENFITSPNTSPMAYFYIDYVEVRPFSTDTIYNCDMNDISEIVAFDGSLPESGRVVLANLNFEFDKAIILQESFYELDRLVALLLSKPYLNIILNGHTDNKGGLEYNQTLSEERALAVKTYLITKGVSRMRVTTKGYGSTVPLTKNNTEERQALNRRVEIEVQKTY